MKSGVQIDWAFLVKQAWAARKQAYSRLAESGKVYSGCNVENTSFGLTVCAERSAVTAAIQAGCRKFSGIAIVADTETLVVPCGACRHFLAEFYPALPIYLVGRGGVSLIRGYFLNSCRPLWRASRWVDFPYGTFFSLEEI